MGLGLIPAGSSGILMLPLKPRAFSHCDLEEGEFVPSMDGSCVHLSPCLPPPRHSCLLFCRGGGKTDE